MIGSRVAVLLCFYWAEHCQCVTHSSNVYLKYAVVFISSLNRCNMMQNDQLTINPYKISCPFNNTNRFKKVKVSVYIVMRAFFTNRKFSNVNHHARQRFFPREYMHYQTGPFRSKLSSDLCHKHSTQMQKLGKYDHLTAL